MYVLTFIVITGHSKIYSLILNCGESLNYDYIVHISLLYPIIVAGSINLDDYMGDYFLVF